QVADNKQRIVDLGTSVNELQGVTSQAAFSGLVHQALPIVTKIKHVEHELTLLQPLTAHERKAHARTILLYICNNLLDKQVELDERIVGVGTGADNIITSSSKAARDEAPFFTQHQSAAARRAFEYYELYEAILLQYRVEWWHAIGEPGAYVQHQVD